MSEAGGAGKDTTLELLRRARDGDDGALNRLYEKVVPAVRRWARGQVPREARGLLDTDDLVQETLGRTLGHVEWIETSRSRGFYLYLRETLRNRIRDELRRVDRRPAAVGPVSSQIPDGGIDPLAKAIDQQTRDRYEAALERLDPEERGMVVARIEFGLPWREVAETSGKPSEDAARVAVSRALARIAADMSNDG